MNNLNVAISISEMFSFVSVTRNVWYVAGQCYVLSERFQMSQERTKRDGEDKIL